MKVLDKASYSVIIQGAERLHNPYTTLPSTVKDVPLVHAFRPGLSERDDETAISSCQYRCASILTCLTPFTGHGMNQSHLVYSLGTRTKKRSTT